jgi:hypothetical protein
MVHRFVTYFTLKGAWRSCDVTEVGSYGSEQAAMRAGQQHALQHAARDPQKPCRLVWKRIPVGLAAPTTFGRYDIRKATGEILT